MALVARYTGWGKDYILWELGLAEGNALIHASLRMQNIPTQWAGSSSHELKILDEL